MVSEVYRGTGPQDVTYIEGIGGLRKNSFGHCAVYSEITIIYDLRNLNVWSIDHFPSTQGKLPLGAPERHFCREAGGLKRVLDSFLLMKGRRGRCGGLCFIVFLAHVERLYCT